MICDAEQCPHRPLWSVVMEELGAAPAGLSEFELIRRLERRDDAPGFEPGAMREPLSLFQVHFTLFHCLYHLQDRLAEEGRALQVNCLRIALESADGRAQNRALAGHDPLRDYYLDLENLSGVDSAQVEAMLGQFWQWFARQDQRQDALAVLGLEGSPSSQEIKAQYRRLAMEHHPDRGGDTRKLQELNEAMTDLGF
jgi:hypothetical protein